MGMRLAKIVLQQLTVRPRLVIATIVGLTAAALLPAWISRPTRALLAWDAGAGLYLVLAWIMMLRATVDRMQWRARRQDDGAVVILVLTVSAAGSRLAAIAVELIGVTSYPPGVP